MPRPRAPSTLLPLGQPGDGDMRVPRSCPRKAPGGSSPGALVQPRRRRRFSCPLEEPPVLPPSASDAGGFVSRRAALPPEPAPKESPFVRLGKRGPRRRLTPSPRTDLRHPKTQSPLSHGTRHARGWGWGQPPTLPLGSGLVPGDAGMGHRGWMGMEQPYPAGRDGQADGGVLYNQISHLMVV